MNLQVRFRAGTELPPWVQLVFHTVNAVPKSVSLASVGAALAAREPLELLLKPITPAKRKLEAVQNLKEKDE